jgi:dienelactone hydrolase
VAGRAAGGSKPARRVDERLGIAEEVEFFGGDVPLFGCRHLPVEARQRSLGVVVCSPILTDFGANYRREVDLARQLAAAGVPVQRFHPRGTGHSAGDRLDLTLTAMVDDTLAAVERLMVTTEVERIALVGTRFAALAAAEAARRSGPVPIVLWEPVLSATGYFREGLRAESVRRLKQGGSGIEDASTELEAYGFLDLLGIPVGAELFATDPSHDLVAALGHESRPLLLVQFEQRDDLRADYRRAVEGWTEAGLDVTTEILPTDEGWWFIPDRLAPPGAVVGLTAAWLLDRAGARATVADRSAGSPEVPAFEERPVFVPSPAGELLAVVTEPPQAEARGVAAVMLRGAGWRPSSGPRRTQTRTTRSLAALGYHGVRFSYHGIAESGGEDEEVIRLDRPYVADTTAVCGWVLGQGLRPLLVGNCFGARTALATAAVEPSVAGLVLLVPPVHDFEVARRLDRRPLSHFARRLAPGHLRAVLRDRSRRQALGRTAQAMLDVAGRRLRLPGRAAAGPGDPDVDGRGTTPEWLSHRFMDQLAAVLDRDIPVLFVYGEDDPYGKDFDNARTGALGRLLDRPGARVRIETVPGRVHGLTSHATQEAVLAAILDWAACEPVGATR